MLYPTELRPRGSSRFYRFGRRLYATIRPAVEAVGYTGSDESEQPVPTVCSASLPALLRRAGARRLQRQHLQERARDPGDVPGLEFTRLEPELLTNLAGGLFILPFVLFSGLAGQLADRYDKALVLKCVKAAEIAIMGVAGLGSPRAV